MESGRSFLKSQYWEVWGSLATDQRSGHPAPAPQKPYSRDVECIDLIPQEAFRVGSLPVLEAVRRRRSRRQYTGEPITLEELSYLLWATQGVRSVAAEGRSVLRTVPSAGARHPFETYLFARSVDGLERGLYRYLGVEHQLCVLSADERLLEDVHLACYEQYVMSCAVVFIWTAVPYRTEWRYSTLAHKLIAQDSGHVCQNLYFACESLGIGVCAIGAYHQTRMDSILEIDGEEEFTIYAATVGRVEEAQVS